MLVVIQAAASLPVTVDEAKLHWRVENVLEDTRIEQMLKAATELVQRETCRILQPSTLQERYDAWSRTLHIPWVPVRAVGSVAYLDEDGIEQTIDDTEYDLDRVIDGAVVKFSDDLTFPTLADGRKGAVRVTFEAGYADPQNPETGDDPDFLMPDRVRETILMIGGHWYENREASAIGVSVAELPLGFQRLTASLRVY